MKKRRLKKWVRLTINLTIITIIAVGFIFLANARAEQIDRSLNYVEAN